MSSMPILNAADNLRPDFLVVLLIFFNQFGIAPSNPGSGRNVGSSDNLDYHSLLNCTQHRKDNRIARQQSAKSQQWLARSTSKGRHIIRKTPEENILCFFRFFLASHSAGSLQPA